MKRSLSILFIVAMASCAHRPAEANIPDDLSDVVPTVVAGKRPGAMWVLRAQWDAQQAIPNSKMVILRDLEKHPKDQHTNTAGLLELGRIFAKAYLNMSKESNNQELGQEVKMPVATDLSSHGVTQAELDGLDTVMLQAIQRGKIKGCSYLVAHKGEIVYRKAHGAFTTGEQVLLASVSKPFAASALMALVDQGKVKLEDPVEKYLPEFKGIKVEGSKSPVRPMTVRHLLSHTAGFWGNKKTTPEKRDLIRNPKRPLDEAVNGIAKFELLHEPGTQFLYSGSGYCVAGRVAEAALGDQSFEKVAQDALFRPLGMNRTTYAPTSARPFILVGGSLNSTLDDMAVFGQMHLNDGVYNGKQILSKASVTEQRRLQIPEERWKAYGLGWFRGSPDQSGLANLLFHSGVTGPNFRIDRRRQTVTVFLVRSSAQNVVNIKDGLNQRVEQMFPVPKSLPDGPSQAKRRGK